jgi:RNA ligase
MSGGKESEMLPDYPRTPYLPYKAEGKDFIVSEKDAAIIFSSENNTIEDKIDGANTGMLLFEGHPIIRNRNHLLNKAFIQRKTASKMQFASIFGWAYENLDKFDAINEKLGFPASIYGEWMYAAHGIEYNKLPALWIPYDIYDWQEKKFLPSILTRQILTEVGFHPPTLIYSGKINNYEQLETFCKENSPWSKDGVREGIYIKTNDATRIVFRAKMVREGFVQGEKWSDTSITRNKVIKPEGAK